MNVRFIEDSDSVSDSRLRTDRFDSLFTKSWKPESPLVVDLCRVMVLFWCGDVLTNGEITSLGVAGVGVLLARWFGP